MSSLSFFFFKQKTAYEMRISDWSSDVCSSDLGRKMAEELFVATRKGLFLVEGGGRQAPRNLGFLGDPVSAFLEDRRDGTLCAALNLGHFGVKLHRSEDFGATWTEIGRWSWRERLGQYGEVTVVAGQLKK